MANRSSQRPIVQRISRKPRLNRSAIRSVGASRQSLRLQRCISKPAEAAPETVVALQRSYGNRAVQRLTADQTSEGGALDASTSAAIERSQGGGQPLADSVRNPLEHAFQSDFSQVRVHADPQADKFNRSVQAEAFTLGHDIYFRKDNYAPSTATGKKLIAHELTHVVQQTGQPAPAVQRKADDQAADQQFKAADPKGHVAALHPSLQAKAQALIENAHKKGLNIFVFQGLRTIAEQDALYAQGRTTKGSIVTNAKGGESYHNYGVALDVVFHGAEPWGEKHDWQALGAAGKEAGLEWGGDWAKFLDRPHFQLPGLKLSQLQAWNAEGGMANVWKNIGEAPAAAKEEQKQAAASGNTPAASNNPSYAGNASQYFDVANQITSIMEGGSTKGSYGALTTINDGGLISYGKHQATLSSGSLGSILNAYIASSKSANAEVVRKNITRVNQKDVTLKDDKNFLEALRGAAGEKEMQVAQDLIFSEGYWNPAVKAAQKTGIQSPLGFAMLYDTKIQGGMESCMATARTKCGGDVGAKIDNKTISEIDFLKAFNDAREERLEAIAVAAEAKGELTKAKAVRGSKYRCRAFRKLLEAGNLNVAGPEGTVEVLGPGGKAYQIEGFTTQVGGTSTTPQTGESKDKPATSPNPSTPTQGSSVTAVAGVAQVTADALNVRQGPDATTTKLGTLIRGTQATVTGREGKWLRITYQGKPAFIHGDYVQFTPAMTAPKLNFVEQTFQIGQGLFKEAAEVGKDLWNWIGKQFDASVSQGGQPATAAPTTPKLAYESQRDNAYDQKDDNGKRVYGGVMCNVTTLAMQLQTLAGNKEKAVDAAVQLLQKNGDTTPAPVLRQKQLEDLLMARFDQISKKNEWPTLLGKEYKQAAHWHVQNKIPWNQIASAINRVGLEFTTFIAKAEHNEPDDGKGNTQEKLTSEEYYRKTLGPITEKEKATAMLSTSMTGGHIVLFAQALSDGILINDPYGALLKEAGASNYIANGLDKNTAATRIKGAGEQVIKDRLKYNKAALNNLMSVIAPDNKAATKVSQNIGELNFYTWNEIKKFTICKWNNILYKK
ncbi:Peptidoglycan L-alanyl-D-glutamate endopeptidase CwlK [Thermoflexales bacterium]|nr:Peptidoglycan L-alanyl-D-glutamate endopeptidase CwlK [Thermoflexales bacterium]